MGEVMESVQRVRFRDVMERWQVVRWERLWRVGRGEFQRCYGGMAGSEVGEVMAGGLGEK